MKWFINICFSFVFCESHSSLAKPPVEFDFFQKNASYFTYLTDETKFPIIFPNTFASCVWIDVPLIFKIIESYSNLFSKYCINDDLLFSFFTIENSLHMDNLFEILFSKQLSLSSTYRDFRQGSILMLQ